MTTTQTRRWGILRLPLVVAIILTAATVASATAQTDGDTYTGCLRRTGHINKVAIGDQPLRPCNSRQVEISWSQTGPMGPVGPVGPQGPEGPPGAGPGFYGVNLLVEPPDLEQPDPIPNDGVPVGDTWLAGEYVASCEPGDVAVDITGVTTRTQRFVSDGVEDQWKDTIDWVPVMENGTAPNSFANLTNVASLHYFELTYVRGFEEGYEGLLEFEVFLTCADMTP